MVVAVKSAMTWGKPPGFMLGGPSEWTSRDRIMAVAYQLYTQMLCPECGQPLEVCRDGANDGWFEVERGTCYARKAVDELRGEKSYKPEPGEILYPVLKDHEETTSYGARPW